MEGKKQEALNQNDPSEFVDLDNLDAFEMPANPEQDNAENAEANPSGGALKITDQASEEDRDAKSVFVKNVHYSAEKKEVEEHFNDCGEIKQITIAQNKMTHQPLG
jgi:RNA recognition motif-containing protein